MDVCFQEISHQEYYIISTMYLQSTAWTFKDIIFLMPYLALKILEAKWRLKYIFVLLLVYCSGKKKSICDSYFLFMKKKKANGTYEMKTCAHLFAVVHRWAQPPWKRQGTLYENDSICVTISCSRILQSNSLQKSGKRR